MFRVEEKSMVGKETKEEFILMDDFLKESSLVKLSGKHELYLHMVEFLAVKNIMVLFLLSKSIFRRTSYALQENVAGRESFFYKGKKSLEEFAIHAIPMLFEIKLYELNRLKTTTMGAIERFTGGRIEDTDHLNSIFNLKYDIKMAYIKKPISTHRSPEYQKYQDFITSTDHNYETIDKIGMREHQFWNIFFAKDITVEHDGSDYCYRNSSARKNIDKLDLFNQKIYILVALTKELIYACEKEDASYIELIEKLFSSYFVSFNEVEEKAIQRKLVSIKETGEAFVRKYELSSEFDLCYVWRHPEYVPYNIKYSIFASIRYKPDQRASYDSSERNYAYYDIDVKPEYFYPYRDAINNYKKAFKVVNVIDKAIKKIEGQRELEKKEFDTQINRAMR